jgi:hypothetical protein
MSLNPVLAEKLNTALAWTLPAPLTVRDARLPAVAAEVHAVTGMRRAGKTTFLRQLLAERRASRPVAAAPEDHGCDGSPVRSP